MNHNNELGGLFGAPVFSPERLTTARQRRKLTMKALAELIGVTAMTITRYERGGANPDSSMVESLATTLSISAAFLYGNESDSIDVEAVSFRARRAMTATVRDKTLATGSIASVTLSPEFHRRFTMPALDLPDLSEYQDRPATAARMLRHHWKLGVGPIMNMIRTLEAKGVEVYWIAEDSPSVDAVSFWRDRRPFVIMNSVDKAGERCRYNAAHELAHLVLHRNVSVKDGFEIEKQADTFASAFLLAGEQFYYECPKSLVLSNFFPLKRRWGVSIQAMVRRGKDLGVYREYQYERAFKEISSLG
jgi:Zn-dependent peptidase ImmA (M78 family)/DNA-binding XRE family transcriptional regulator